MEYFITGIDTDIGKTFITKGLALAFENCGKKVGVFKPLQSGALETDKGLLAPDLEAIKELSQNIKTKLGEFQPTHPLRGATGTQYRCGMWYRHFNPRTPCGVRHNQIHIR